MSSHYMHDTSFFPQDSAGIPAHLELMRVGQVTDAVSRNASCLVPIAALDASAKDAPLGFDPGQDEALSALASEQNAVIAPAIWYCATGCQDGRRQDGTFDMPAHAFAAYLENVLTTLYAIGFRSVDMVTYVDAADPVRSALLVDTCEFVRANLFNDLWKDPLIGKNWWDRPDKDELNWQRHARYELRRPEHAGTPVSQPPLRLEMMTPRQLQDCIAKGYPLFVPSAVLENHGNQNPIGCDGFEAQDPLLRAASVAPAVVAPTIWYGPTCYGVSGPELATTDIDGHIYYRQVEGVIEGLAAMGWRDITFVQVHQGLSGVQGAATAMAIRAYRAAHARHGEAGVERRLEPAHVELIGPPAGQYDHAGRNETSWMLYLRPDNTDLSLLRENDYLFCWDPGNEAKLATAEWGASMCKNTIAGFVELINSKFG